ncbi:MAG: hypothetical protein ACKVS9_08375 [Phycisphaerae bacterium]
MNISALHHWTLKQRIDFAHTTTLCLGMGLLFLALAPLFITRVVADLEPDRSAWVANLAAMLLAATFLTLSVLIRHRRRWAVWTAFLVSTLMVACGIAVHVILGVHSGSSFVLVLSGLTCYGSWRAIDGLHRAEHEEAEGNPSPL